MSLCLAATACTSAMSEQARLLEAPHTLADESAEEEQDESALAHAPRRPSERRRAAETPSARAEKQERQVAVQGIEGTLSNFDVRVVMDKRAKEFASCHEPRARNVPALSGSIEFKIHVLRDGKVSHVQVRASDLGDRVLERCLSEVIAAAKFPEPHGGEADVTWNMQLEPAGRHRAPEQWELERVQRVVRKHGDELLESCAGKRATFTVTAYVSAKGKVLAAGVAARERVEPEQFDCIAENLRSWTMPKPRKGIAKVSFPIRSGA